MIAILRGDFGGREAEIACVLFDAGVTAVEVTLNSPDALGTIRRIEELCGDHMAIGAGTVMSPDDVRAAADSGAQFIVSPNRDRSVIETTKRLNLASFPGCFTPSEIVEALDAGADAAKVFPALSLGPAFIKALRGPLEHARLVPTGGVTPAAARDYFAAGAWAVGVGSELVGGECNTKGWLDRVRERAGAYSSSARGV
ncbi:MAG: bifunctional 4-hydroxy-2-oxoglutarate aldolase/2-dehydro-3-deoxy-phosphogluconate aldolase [Verrucomicrobia bacterium]|nr:bifunctional 4-hydroxy-2-oxoglutarate aldolase/2-dehydro-3-deoxy-phosphogluconate aldolase [Verrucomicrobiota bacterium]